MKQKIIVIICLFASINSFSQLDNATINKLALQLMEAFKKDTTNNEGFSPISVMDANLNVFEVKNSLGFITVRKLLLSNTFANTKDLFQWLVPKVNKVFIEKYSEERNPLLIRYKPLLAKLNSYVCQCLEINTKSKDPLYDNNLHTCVGNYLKDSVLMKEYLNTYMSLSEQDKPRFLMAAMLYAQVNCEVFFNMAIEISQTDLHSFFDRNIEGYKNSLINELVRLGKEKKSDSLKQLFPEYGSNPTALKELLDTYKNNNYKIIYNNELLVQNKNFQRINSFIVTILPNKKIKLLGQAVYEIGLDKPLFYVKNLKFYSRDGMQGVPKLEAEIRQSIPEKDLE